ncbi:hypothetical protein N7462_004973 [Penicillium macrosclerotiorum]|uniref:uncharacterized protein n=1 Tax=Penicillium macrosclerotiorum TaxID=303699 RepID=UPI0025478004|nr:uncharacterized protein N7462_004973 [Penicillium macrosclerotiorum]KAJ5690581.1 hypothetical protein N7462_004973 [Penicillium macrosclerotiorum]
MTQYPPYTPASSLGRELGIMFGFLGACAVTMGVYSLIWRCTSSPSCSPSLANEMANPNPLLSFSPPPAVQRRALAQDLARRKAFHAHAASRSLVHAGPDFGPMRTEGRSRVFEKRVGDRAELPVQRGGGIL